MLSLFCIGDWEEKNLLTPDAWEDRSLNSLKTVTEISHNSVNVHHVLGQNFIRWSSKPDNIASKEEGSSTRSEGSVIWTTHSSTMAFLKESSTGIQNWLPLADPTCHGTRSDPTTAIDWKENAVVHKASKTQRNNLEEVRRIVVVKQHHISTTLDENLLDGCLNDLTNINRNRNIEKKEKGETRTASCANASFPCAQETRWQRKTGAEGRSVRPKRRESWSK